MAELTAPLVYKNEEKRIVYGPVLIPDEPDTDDDVVTAEQIENVAHKFVEEYGNIDLMHSLYNVGRLVESYILPYDLEVDEDMIVPKGSWMMGVRVTDGDAWEAVKDGKLGGFSIMALQKTAMKSSEKKQKSKRVTLADLGDDWIVNAVSLVDEPAVPKAKWIAIKSKNNSNNDINIDIDSGVVEKAVEGSLEHRKQLLDQKLESMFAGFERYPIIHSTLEDSVIFYIYDDQGTQKTFQVDYQLDENGNVEFTSEPQEVRIEENVVPIENLLVSTEDDNAQFETKERTEGLMAKFRKSIGLAPKTSEKAGRIISDNNFKKLKQAKEAIDELLAIGEKERESEKNTEQKGAKKMNKDDVVALIDERMEPINSKLDDVLKAMKEEAKGADQQEEKTQASEKSKDDEQQQDEETATKSKDDQEDYKEKYEEVLKQLVNRPFSHRLTGQDGVEKSKEDEPKDDRNAFGYKRK